MSETKRLTERVGLKCKKCGHWYWAYVTVQCKITDFSMKTEIANAPTHLGAYE